MSIEAKRTLINTLERRLSERLTAADMAKALETLSDVLAGFDVQQITNADPGKDDLLAAYISAMQIQGRSEKTLARYDAYNGRVQNIGVSISEGIDMMRAFRQDRETDEERDARERYEARQEAELEERRRKIAENKADREKEEYQREKERLDRKYGVTA